MPIRSQPITPSAPTDRVLDVLELLARASGRGLRFSDIVKHAQLTQATGHAILMTLCDRGWAARDAHDKSFRLGPAFSAVAARADLARPLVNAARAAARRLSTETGYAASVVERVGDTLVITAFEGENSHQPAGTPGDRIPYAPPFGVVFAAWDDAPGRRAWIDKAAAAQPELAGRLEQALTRTRRRGFDIDWTTPALAQTVQLAGTLRDDGLPPHVGQVLDQLLAECATVGLLSDDDGDDDVRPVASIGAPVFDHSGRVAMILSVHPLGVLQPGAVSSIGQRLAAAASAVGSRPISPG